jgi:hypothetical protein
VKTAAATTQIYIQNRLIYIQNRLANHLVQKKQQTLYENGRNARFLTDNVIGTKVVVHQNVEKCRFLRGAVLRLQIYKDIYREKPRISPILVQK